MPLRMYTLYLGEDQLAALKEHSQRQQVPVSRYIRQAVDIFLGSGQPCLVTSGLGWSFGLPNQYTLPFSGRMDQP